MAVFLDPCLSSVGSIATKTLALALITCMVVFFSLLDYRFNLIAITIVQTVTTKQPPYEYSVVVFVAQVANCSGSPRLSRSLDNVQRANRRLVMMELLSTYLR